MNKKIVEYSGIQFHNNMNELLTDTDNMDES